MTRKKKRTTEASEDLRKISGFLAAPRTAGGKRLYRGRLSYSNVQSIGIPPDVFATFTITAEQIADAADNRLIWTDQDVQRGVQPGLVTKPPREFCVADGYPDPQTYIFSTEKADEICEKLLTGQKVYLNALVWNLRPGKFEAYWDRKTSDLYIYSGRIYLPDSHHRHQAIVKAVRVWRESPDEYPRFSGSHEFKIELYFLSREDEGNYFFAKNLLPKPTAKSKAYDLTTLDDLSMLAKRVIEHSSSLKDNVNRVTDRLTSRNPQVVTLSTLREMMKGFADFDDLDEADLEGTAVVAAKFYDQLAKARPELGHVPQPLRKKIRKDLLVDAAVMMHGYAGLMRAFNEDLARLGPNRAYQEWDKKLAALKSDVKYRFGRWSGDVFEKRNPLWASVGVVKPGKDGRKLTVLNTGAARIECARVLRAIVTGFRITDLRHLAR